MEYEFVLGLEVHLQLNTKTKIFCWCKNDPFYAKEPNINVCPVCLGLPGALPVLNKEAVNKSQQMAAALNSEVQGKIIFERKNYFYPDLPKGYQITCPHYPIGKAGAVDLTYFYDDKSSEKNHIIRLREVHLEEDTAKSMHKNDKTYIDFNKSGVPLLEIVSEPDIRSVDDAVEFCKEIQRIARTLEVSEADMEKGNMRLEANVSVRVKGDTKLPDYRVELKNINSYGFMKKAVSYELRRQVLVLENGEKLHQETRGFNESTGETFVQRSKEEADDYRYFPEPDIPPFEFDLGETRNITTLLPELPKKMRADLQKDGLNTQYVNILLENSELRRKYKELISAGYSSSESAKCVINVSKYKGLSADKIINEEKSKSSSLLESDNDLSPIIDAVLKENPEAVEDVKKGNENAIKFLIGNVMRRTSGKADPRKTSKLIRKKLS
ncbi:hypothetical protein A2982_04060 [candidate division WWE3 bacterium RIFCSPLOWO2_01_FULL_39_13]|uniref:Aspartyl/glutamyl-tRNA(Asn/Gln) amidotransferase subunit B n=1 Tax=candidate division WWE3 bacterium RIFCSPLOWO2_01_FULL_39_13 TaxID=1802624 RepID=A0A1F4V239_UNCKA|nr:MAG: hypothetical protein A2982_04060 [candidate division WWE3 bacterium RIFCSPLOWO2_01_FULL_39_13]